MKKNTQQKTYSISETNNILKKYIETSSERLVANLKVAWKKNSKIKQHQHVGN